jgi:hypothetical protein
VHNYGSESYHRILNYISQNVTEYCGVMGRSPVSYLADHWLNISTRKQRVVITKVTIFWDVAPCGLV